MSKLCGRALLLRSAVVLLALGAASVTQACKLPLDPYVVALPDTINGVSVQQFHGWVQNPNPGDPDNQQPYSGYLIVPAGANITWKIYWDPSEGGKNPQALQQLGIPPGSGITPDKTGFEVLRGPPAVPVDLYDLSFAAILGQTSFKKPMKVAEVYDRDAGTGGWTGTPAGAGPNNKRVTAPWVIPNAGVLEEIKDINGVPFLPVLALAGTSNVAAGKGIGQDPNSPGWLTTMFGASPNYTGPFPQTNLTPGGGGGSYQWVMDPASPQWSPGGKGGTWTFVDVKGRWKMNVKGTGKTNQPDTDVQGLSIDFKFDTPSEPFFYLVQPIGEFEFNLATDTATEYYTWTEKKVIYDPSGTVTATPIPTLPQPEPDVVLKLTANGIFKKGNSGPKGGVPTLVMVQDNTPPMHVHLENQGTAAYTGQLGAAMTGSSKFVVVDNNPYAGYTGALPTLEPRAGAPVMKFAPANLKADFYYSMPVNEFAKGDLTQLLMPPDPDFALDQSGAMNTYPYLKERWVWFKSPTQPPGVWQAPFTDGAAAAGAAPAANTLYGNGANPAFTIGEYTCDASLLDNPLPIHHVPTSVDITNPDSSLLNKWDKRLKFFIAPTDASLNVAPLNANGAGFTGAESANIVTPAAGTSVSAALPLPAGEPYITGATEVQVPGAPLNINWQPAVGALSPCAHDKQKLGTMGFMDGFTDTVKPSVVLLVKDTKYERTYILNDQLQGWWAHPKIAPGTLTGTTDDNKDWPGVLPSKDIEKIEFGTAAGGSDPAAFTAQVANGWTAFTPPNTREGIYVDEDTRLLFQVLAWDNVNWKATPIPAGQVSWHIKNAPSNVTPDPDKSSVPDLNAKNKFEYVFRDPNWGPGVAGGQDCSLTVDVDDSAPSPNRRELIVHFYVASNKLKILTLEEKRGNK